MQALQAGASSKIGYTILGTAPCRQLIVQYDDMLLGNVTCVQNKVNLRITIQEHTGIIQVIIKNKPLCNTPNDSRGIIGVQNENGTLASTPANKNNTYYNEHNTAYQLTPNGNTSLIQSSQLRKQNQVISQGTLLPNGDVQFPQYCFATPWDTLYTSIVYNKINSTGTFTVTDTLFLEKQTIALNCSTIVQSSYCNNANGSIKVLLPALADTAAYSYTIDNNAYVSTNTFTGLLTGTYLIKVKSISGTCTYQAQVYVPGVDNVVATATTIPATCGAASNGNIQVQAVNGSPPYMYSFNNAALSTNNTLTNAYVGAHFITVRDSANCIYSFYTSVGAQPSFTVSLDSTNALCQEVPNGTITVIAVGSTGPYTYSIDGISYQQSNVFTGLMAGIYTVITVDAGGCGIYKNIQIDYTNSINFSTSIVRPTCIQANNGTITVLASGGTTPYTYSLGSGSAYTTNNVFTNITAGPYIIYVKDASGCITSDFIVVESIPIFFEYVVQSQTCTDNNGIITVTSTTGVPPILYSLNGGAYTPNNTFTGLAAGTYVVYIKDSFNCVTYRTITVNSEDIIQATFTVTPTSCFGVNDGSILVNANSNTNYTYSINGGNFTTNPLFSNLFGTTYTITIKYMFCKKEYVVQVPQGPSLTFTTSNINNTCQTNPNGSITITPTSGMPPYRYYINSQQLATNIASNLTSNIYNLTLEDSKGCIGTKTVIITNNFTLGFTTNITSASCAIAANGSIIVLASGGSNYMYSINGGTPQASNTFSNLTTGTYAITIMDQLNCPVTRSVFVNAINTLQLQALVIQPISCINSTATVQLNPIGGSPNFTYRRLPNGAFQSSSIFNNLNAGNYSFLIRDSVGCTATSSVSVIQPTKPILSITSTQPACNGEPNGIISVNVVNGTPPFAFTLNNTLATNQSIISVPSGVYNLKVTDALDCTDSVTIRITQNTPISIQLTIDKHAGCTNNDDTKVTVLASGGIAPYYYSTNGINYGVSNVVQLPAGNHTVYVRDSYGCT